MATNFELTITANDVKSTDERFTMDNLYLGDNYTPLDVYFKKADGAVVKRSRNNRERQITNQTMPRLAFQVFEKQISALSVEDKENFPICKYNPNTELICGIYSSEDEYRRHRNSIEYLTYKYDNDRQFVIYSWNIFSTIIFVQECLKRFGELGDKFVMIYQEKDKKETEVDKIKDNHVKKYSKMLEDSGNLIFHGAPGTGKSYLAKEIAADIISDGYFDNYNLLSDEQKKQVEFVQFHPSYDYSDFVEGLRPKVNDDGTMGFELQDGIFKKFVARARKNYEDSQKTKETIEKETSVQESITEFLSNIEPGVDNFKTIKENEFTITDMDDKHIYIFIPGNAVVNKLTLKLDEIRRMLESEKKFDKVEDVATFLTKKSSQENSYVFALYKKILERKNEMSEPTDKIKEIKQKKYIFIIDEINRGEISKIFGELFFAIDPGYRGRAGEISTQYTNMHEDSNEKFYIPDNVYIIGTMNDIDRSVDTFDFAMRRRFRFVEMKADEHVEMLSELDETIRKEAINRMTALNKAIAETEGLNESYQIGAAYFLKLKTLDFDQLWTDYLKPLLQEYVRGMPDEKNLIKNFEKAYHIQTDQGVANESSQN
ncbi:MAG: AAA family ATPase [Treponema sp.]|nr:AAA family ATPase [Treponema sp.]